jgi:hypothetical protein
MCVWLNASSDADVRNSGVQVGAATAMKEVFQRWLDVVSGPDVPAPSYYAHQARFLALSLSRTNKMEEEMELT